MNDKISFEIKTASNLFIGGAPAPFEIGGIDQSTVTDQNDFPYIPASSIKGTLATIIREDDSDMAAEISKLYRAYLLKMRADNQEQVKKLVKEKASLERIEKSYERALGQENLSGHLFGMSGFNNTPKLLFSNLMLNEKYRNKDKCFSIDMKNSISIDGERPESNPRSYKTVRSGLVFGGVIRLYKITDLGENAEELCKNFIIHNLSKMNEGIYRLGNSKSRGYGKVEVYFSESIKEIGV